MRLTIENIPDELEKALRARAEAEGKTMNDLALEALRSAAAGTRKRDFSGVAGTWVDDPAFEQVRRAHDQIDPDVWR
jgi:plasmid stability protein